MDPISNARMLWLEQRIFVLGRMIQELTLNQARYQSRPRYANQNPIVMDNMICEQLQLVIELNVLEQYHEETAPQRALPQEPAKVQNDKG